MQEWLVLLVQVHPYFVYAAIFFVSFFEGPILAMLCGLLIRLGFFPFLPIYLTLMAGDLIGDTFWYSVGRYFGHRFVRRFGRYFSVTEKGINTVEHIFHKYTNWILIVNKLTMGLGFALVTLVTAGMVKIPFKRYISLNLVGQFFWTAFLLGVGYLFGHVYESVGGIFGKISVAGLFVIAFLCLLGFGKYVQRRITKQI